jgi:glycerophosphoryl diester phosphodiesterase
MHKGVLNIAHRGASGHAPENTMAAFRLAIEQGADAIELDVHQTADGHLVVLHDFSLKRTTGDPRSVKQAPLFEIKKLDAGAWWSRMYRGESVPALQEVLELTHGRIPLHIELKRGSPFYPMIEVRLIELIRRMKAHAWVTVSSFDEHALRILRDHDPKLALGLLTRLRQPKPILYMARELSVRSLHISTRRFSPALLQRAQAFGLPVYVYTINQPAAMREYIQLGVNGLFTNYPDRLAALLGRPNSA